MSFPDAVSWLADLFNLGTGSSTPRPRRKDGGVDVIAWRPFRDGRAGYAIVLCQCTAQLNWVPKAKDIVLGQWRGWIDLGLDPLTALAVPFAVSTTFDRWDELKRTVNIILERIRLCELLSLVPIERLEDIRRWTEAERELLGAEPSS